MLFSAAFFSAAFFALASVALAVPFNLTQEKRQQFTNERFTWYYVDVGLGACGQEFQDSDFVVAMNIDQYNSDLCYEDITITVGSLTTTATIVDMCPGCPFGGLDFSPGLFDFFTWPGAAGSATDPGVLSGSWTFGSGSSGESPSGGSPKEDNPAGSHTIHPNGDSSKCLDVVGANFADGTPVDIYDCNGTGAQNWVINSGTTAVQVAGTNFCLDAGTTPGDGTHMKIWQCYSGLMQQTWYYTSDDRIALQNQGQCLDLTNGSNDDGTVMQIWACTTGDTNQIWTLD